MPAVPHPRHPSHVHGVPLRILSTVAAVVLMGGFADSASAIPDPDAAARSEDDNRLREEDVTPAAPEPEDKITFNAALLMGDRDRAVDLSRFERGDGAAPGTYRADVHINGNWTARENVTLRAPTRGAAAHPCFTRAMLERYRIDVARLSRETLERLDDEAACTRLEDAIPGATVDFDPADLRLSLTVPQASMRTQARGYVDPALWDRGVDAGFVNYNASLFHIDSAGMRTSQGFVGLNAGLNVAGWQLRSNSSFSWHDSGPAGRQNRWQNVATYAQRDLTDLRARVTLGESFTSGDVFDSVGFRGAQIATDDRMLPESLRGYAPTVRGLAQTNARVTVRQAGIVIHEITVAPGPFVIEDLYPTGYGGNLEVTVTEADGRQHTFSVPYASVAQLLRPGATRYALTAGQLRDTALSGNAPGFAQGIVQRGVTNLLTLYGGLIGAQGYGAVQGGIALNTLAGAVSFDATTSVASVPGAASLHGQSYGIGYSKLFEPTGTNLTVAAHRYSTSGYLSLRDAARLRNGARHGENAGQPWRTRNRLLLSANQPLGQQGGNMYVSASAQTYWNRAASDFQYQIGYANHWRNLAYNAGASRVRNSSDGRPYTQFFVDLSIPLGRTGSTIAAARFARDTRGEMQAQTSVSGVAGERQQVGYNVYADASRNGPAGSAANGGASLQYRAPYTQLQAGASVGTGYRQLSAGATGSIVAHPAGVTFGQALGDTIAVVEAPNAKGASLSNAPGLRIDGSGHAVVPYLAPYRLNTLDIDPKGSSMDVELDSTSQQVAPHAGAVVMLRYRTVQGRTALIDTRLPDGAPLPFGADVIDAAGNSVGVVGQNGLAYARLPADTGTLTAEWGKAAGQRCRIEYALPAAAATTARALVRVHAICTPEPERHATLSGPAGLEKQP